MSSTENLLQEHLIVRRLGSIAKRSSRRSSILRMSSGSLDSAIQRNGPIARANSGRRNASVKMGMSKALSTPPFLAWVRIRLPLSNTTAPFFCNSSIAVTWRTIERVDFLPQSFRIAAFRISLDLLERASGRPRSRRRNRARRSDR